MIGAAFDFCNQSYHLGHFQPSRADIKASIMMAQRASRQLTLATSSFSSSSIIAPQRRSISLLHKQATLPSAQQKDVDYAVEMVRSHDPAGYLPGRLLPSKQLQTAYYSIRSFWVETGLRFGSTAQVGAGASPEEQLEWWQKSISQLHGNPSGDKHPTLRLLKQVLPPSESTTTHLNDVLQGRRNDLSIKQYSTLQQLEDHAALSCGSLSQLVLESGNLTVEHNPQAHQAARLVGIGHGLTNALRTSIPVISATGKLIIPEDLCVQYGVSSPRYLLSALGQGDDVAKKALNHAVQDIAEKAQDYFQQARALRQEVLDEEKGEQAVSVLLPGLASETFLQRLESSGYDLTDRHLRHVGALEHAQCAFRMIKAYYQKTY